MDIPAYPDFRSLELGDKAFLDPLLIRLQPRISEFTFANLYLFRKAHLYRLCLVGDSPVVLGSGYGGEEYFLPPLDGDIVKALDALLGDGRLLYGADESFVERYLQGRERTEITEDRDSFDYLYLRRELAELPGNRFHKKRNRVRYFTGRHRHAVEPYSEKYLGGSLKLLEEWRRVRAGIESASLLREADASEEALSLAGLLGLQGLVVLVEGEVKAFVLGEKLNETTSVCQFEKADPFLEGLYQFADSEYCRLCFTDCEYVNREQDLGEPNLRRSKLSYHPVELVKKFRVRRAGQQLVG
ncbi:MAG TPA: phosphatidylglycerol lysyltransferase domain-containing protein [Geobacteraceae bacterium]|nr:phosphatidylglycerol lysyltransferase domain-containing protein [Geobacteraceae bacterium]